MNVCRQSAPNGRDDLGHSRQVAKPTGDVFECRVLSKVADMGCSSSDYGFYGKTGEFSCERLPVQRCRCACGPVLWCEYDDTPGLRETVYRLKCDKCHISTSPTCVIESAIAEWNEKMSSRETVDSSVAPSG